jgi:hypothetical protein
MSLHPRSRIVVGLLLTGAALTTAITSGAVPAHAQPALAACTGQTNDSFSPGVTNAPQTITVSEQAQYGCTVPLLGTVSYNANGTLTNFTCSEILTPEPGIVTLRWGNGQTSTFQFTVEDNDVNGVTVLTKTGSITAGLYSGSTATEVLTGATLDLTACETSGITTFSLEGALLIV